MLGWVLCAGRPQAKWPRLVPAAVTVFALCAFLIGMVAPLVTAPWVATVRTLAVSLVALSAGIAGAHYPKEKRIEMVWVGYAAMALLTVKLFVQDFRESAPAALAVALLAYGAVLVIGPRLTR